MKPEAAALPLYAELSLGAQTSYAELYDICLASELSPFAQLKGSFHKRTIKGRDYVYFGFRDADGSNRMAYVGPNNQRVQALVANFDASADARASDLKRRRALACEALGCTPMLEKHFRIVQKLAAYGFFKAGGVLIGTHAFVAFGNMLGVRWLSGDKTMDVDFAHDGKNISLALPGDIRLSVHDALTSLEMGLLPIREFSGAAGAQYRNTADAELRIDFVTSSSGRAELVRMASLGLALEPLKFMEFSLEGTLRGVAFSGSGACVVNLPDPARYAIHKLIVFGERPISAQAKASKDLEQAAALIDWHIRSGRQARVQQAWTDAISRGPGWRKRAEQGRAALLKRRPGLEVGWMTSAPPASTAKARRPKSS